jgi:hypothetical protein
MRTALIVKKDNVQLLSLSWDSKTEQGPPIPLVGDEIIVGSDNAKIVRRTFYYETLGGSMTLQIMINATANS